MIGRRSQVAALAVAGLATMAFAAPSASAAASTGSAAGFSMDLGTHAPPPNCPFSAGDFSLVWLDGNGVQHESTNNNGDWGGFTVEGTAQFQVDGVTWYTGHGTLWGGGGNNKAGQSEGGLTINFGGSGDAGSFRLHADGHMTTNNAGTPTANVTHVSPVCS
ncbi:MAG TPA: hypothetical protein VKQ07_01325 [Jatrophihabitantaceae bacterium]|nr:hypothetical protein [Jatrophihabitantaceae bacterium]